ncbi:MAG: insulinase family protein [Bacteroidales bacterium]|jgi:predicted Zn-dependent peptidase|nr:insulinase family protein [Bacteroidales bacterium]
MIRFERFELPNGLRVLVHEDTSTPLAAVNLMYDVGSRDEDPQKTGFAHLFEHLMFGGSINVPDFDNEMQKAGGENNAFTGNDVTNYYCTLPAENIETAFWLESDRMLQLDFSERNLEVQRQVVIEEFRQRYLNRPYGDVWLLLCPEAYRVHPYRWPTIGKDPEHIRKATPEDVKTFFYRHYAPNNAVLAVSGNVKTERVRQLAEKWFAPVERRKTPVRCLPQEPEHTEAGFLSVRRNVPADAIYKVFHTDGLFTHGYRCADMLTDALASGKSSRLYRRLVKDRQMFSEINAYVTGDADPGLLTVYGKLMPGISPEEADNALLNELHELSSALLLPRELEKIKNRLETAFILEHISILNKAIHLCRHELIGDAADLNRETEAYLSVTAEDIRAAAAGIFRQENGVTLYYQSSEKSS